MKNKSKFLGLILLVIGLCLFFVISCKKANVPILSTTEVSEMSAIYAITGGKISDDKGEKVIARGVCWSTKESPTISDSKTIDSAGIGSFKSVIKNLTANTTYYARAYATNTNGTGYGNEISFTTFKGNNGIMTDIDGNIYKTVTIGDITWMAENLKVTKYNDGTPIPNVTNSTEWRNSTTGAYCNYDNDQRNMATYGLLYNWYSINTGKLCPTGWHVSNNADWETLNYYLGGNLIAGGKLKETGTTHWNSPNEGATNETGFTALPGGYRYGNGIFADIGSYGYWWSDLEHLNASYAYYYYMGYDHSEIDFDFDFKSYGFSVRCVKD